jgi:hypothetical protein
MEKFHEVQEIKANETYLLLKQAERVRSAEGNQYDVWIMPELAGQVGVRPA